MNNEIQYTHNIVDLKIFFKVLINCKCQKIVTVFYLLHYTELSREKQLTASKFVASYKSLALNNFLSSSLNIDVHAFKNALMFLLHKN